VKNGTKPKLAWKSAVLASVCGAGLGLLLFWTDRVYLSYDLLFRIPWRASGGAKTEAVTMVYMDNASFNELHQSAAQTWDLKLHAALVDRLTDDGARVVVFDIIFDVPAPAEARADFARAMRRNGKVVLAVGLEKHQRAQLGGANKILPALEFQEAARKLGIAEVNQVAPTRGTIVRQYSLGESRRPDDSLPSLPWAAAEVAGLEITGAPGAQQPETFLNYYGPPMTLPSVSYREVKDHPKGYFKDKCVFVGAAPKVLLGREQADVFDTPYSLFGGPLSPGVDLAATAFLNLANRDGLTYWRESLQGLVLSLMGLALGALTLMRPWPAAGIGLVAFLGTCVTAMQAASHQTWFAWSVIALVQIPFALAWSLRNHFVRLNFEKEVLTRTLEETTRLVEATKATAGQKPPLFVPDHAMVRLVGRGAYGEVWLARNAIGAFHVVKVVARRGFPSDEPYEREFRGIQKFMPISRSHPGFVHILHVGRNDDEKFFYCVMEAGDDRETGQRINPETYRPKTLATEIDRHGMLMPMEGLRVGLALSEALEHLHRHELIHRDIKPPNIIFVNGAPKFADIGLVTEMGGKHDVSQVGTEGYIAPEGPGTPAADVYSLGKVLYEAIMGRDRRLFPEVPTAVFEAPEESLLRRLNDIIHRACETEPALRFQSAGQLHAALKAVAQDAAAS
jgi:CHASE2 domain-containing sensor protein